MFINPGMIFLNNPMEEKLVVVEVTYPRDEYTGCREHPHLMVVEPKDIIQVILKTTGRPLDLLCLGNLVGNLLVLYEVSIPEAIKLNYYESYFFAVIDSFYKAYVGTVSTNPKQEILHPLSNYVKQYDGT